MTSAGQHLDVTATTDAGSIAAPTLLATCWKIAGPALPYPGRRRSTLPLERALRETREATLAAFAAADAAPTLP